MTLLEKYKKNAVPELMKKFNFQNELAVPRLVKVTLNSGLSQTAKDEHLAKVVSETLRRITGQQPLATKARKSIAGFKVREGMTVGLKVTLRGRKMYDFVDKLINFTLPRVRDFRGLSPKAVDSSGNLTVGFAEHLAFPEVNPDEVDKLHGLEVSLTNSAGKQEVGLELFKLLGFPFQQV